MRRFVVALSLALIAELCGAVDVSTPSGTLTIAIPSTFSPLGHAEIEALFTRTGRLPLVAYARNSGASTISAGWARVAAVPLTQEQLPELKQFMAAHLLKLEPRLRWLQNRIVAINGKNWVHLESMAPGIEFPVHSHSYLTDLHGHMVIVNMSEPDGERHTDDGSFAEAAGSLSTK